MTRVVVLASGAGSTLQALLDAFPTPPFEEIPSGGVAIVAVISNTPGALALDRAHRAGIPAILIDHRGRSLESFEVDLARVIDAHLADLICLAGFLRILSPSFVRRYAGRILNTHPALLPAFGGKGMYGHRVHQAVLEAGFAVSGCTIHIVDEIPDGGPIVAQATVPVLPGDTPETLAERVKAEERRLYPAVIRSWAEGRIKVAGRTVSWNGARQSSR